MPAKMHTTNTKKKDATRVHAWGANSNPEDVNIRVAHEKGPPGNVVSIGLGLWHVRLTADESSYKCGKYQ